MREQLCLKHQGVLSAMKPGSAGSGSLNERFWGICDTK